MEHEVLALVPDVIVLESEEQGEPIEEVVVSFPWGESRLAEVADRAQCSSSSAHLGVAERGVICEEVVDGDDVVYLFLRIRKGLRPQGAWSETHSIRRI